MPATGTASAVTGGSPSVPGTILANYSMGIQRLAGDVADNANLFFHTDIGFDEYVPIYHRIYHVVDTARSGELLC